MSVYIKTWQERAALMSPEQRYDERTYMCDEIAALRAALTVERASLQAQQGTPAHAGPIDGLLAALNNIAEVCNCCGDRSDLAVIAQEALDEYADQSLPAAVPAVVQDAKDSPAQAALSDEQIDVMIDDLLQPAGTRFKFYTAQKTIDAMRGVMRTALAAVRSSQGQHSRHIDQVAKEIGE